jgi:thioesterase domain-containing protein
LSIDFPDKIEKIASLYIDEILSIDSNGPYALSGHCIGGIVAFEMAKQFEAMGKKVQLLAMFDAFVPEKIKREPVTLRSFFQRSALIRKYPRIALQLYLLKRHTKVAIQYKITNLKKLIKKIKERIYTRKKETAGLEIFKNSENLFKTAYGNYRIKPYDKAIVAFYVKEHYYYTDKDHNIIFGIKGFNDNTDNLWKKYASSVTKYIIDGEHSSIFDPKYCERFVKIFQQHLDKSNNS